MKHLAPVLVLVALLAAGWYAMLNYAQRDWEAEGWLAQLIREKDNYNEYALDESPPSLAFLQELTDDQRFRLIATARRYRPRYADNEVYDQTRAVLSWLVQHRPALRERIGRELLAPALARPPRNLWERRWLLHLAGDMALNLHGQERLLGQTLLAAVDQFMAAERKVPTALILMVLGISQNVLPGPLFSFLPDPFTWLEKAQSAQILPNLYAATATTGALSQEEVEKCISRLIRHRALKIITEYSYSSLLSEVLPQLPAWAPSPELAARHALRELAILQARPNYSPNDGDYDISMETIGQLMRYVREPAPALLGPFLPLLGSASSGALIVMLPHLPDPSPERQVIIEKIESAGLNHWEPKRCLAESPVFEAYIQALARQRLAVLLPPAETPLNVTAAEAWWAVLLTDSEAAIPADLRELHARYLHRLASQMPDKLTESELPPEAAWPSELAETELSTWTNKALDDLNDADPKVVSAAGKTLTTLQAIGPRERLTLVQNTILERFHATTEPDLGVRLALVLSTSLGHEQSQDLLRARWFGDWLPARLRQTDPPPPLLIHRELPFPAVAAGKHWRRELQILAMTEQLLREQPALAAHLAPLWQSREYPLPAAEWEAMLANFGDLLRAEPHPALALLVGYELSRLWSLQEPRQAERLFAPYMPGTRGSLSHLWCAAATVNWLTPALANRAPAPFATKYQIPDPYYLDWDALSSETVLTGEFVRIFSALLPVQESFVSPESPRSLVALLLTQHYLEGRECGCSRDPADFMIFEHPFLPKDQDLLELSLDYRRLLPWARSTAPPAVLASYASEILSHRLGIAVDLEEWGSREQLARLGYAPPIRVTAP